jgi:hypothetical protein
MYGFVIFTVQARHAYVADYSSVACAHYSLCSAYPSVVLLLLAAA